MKLTTEQIQEIRSATPDNACFVDLCFDEKPDPNTDYYDEFGSQLNAKGIWTFNDAQAVKPAVLEHLREILELRQEVERLEAQLKERDVWIERIVVHGKPVVERVHNTPENHWIYPTISNFNRVLKQAPKPPKEQGHE